MAIPLTFGRSSCQTEMTIPIPFLEKQILGSIFRLEESIKFAYIYNFYTFLHPTGWVQMNGPPCHTKFDLFSIVLGKSDETMPYRLDLGNSFAVVYIAVTNLVQELY